MGNSGTVNATEDPRTADADDSAEQPRPTCFVIQPFDQGKFDKRYEDAFEPALAQAGFAAYRVDVDPGTDVLITAIEEGIRRAAICLADVTKNNPNVWYELGYAYAAGKHVILTCCDEREGPLPFDIHHRHVIHYQSESTSDFNSLKRVISQRAKVLLDKVAERQMDDADPIAPHDGLPQREVHLLGLAAGPNFVGCKNEFVIRRILAVCESSGMSASWGKREERIFPFRGGVQGGSRRVGARRGRTGALARWCPDARPGWGGRRLSVWLVRGALARRRGGVWRSADGLGGGTRSAL